MLSQWIPPALLQLAKSLFFRFGFSGNYSSWEDARQHSTGYDIPQILEKTRVALLKVKRGEAIYERDSVLFERKEHFYPLLACLLFAGRESDGRISILDFGGSLGTSYYQCREFLPGLQEWSIVEQKPYIDCGKLEFEDEILKFYYSIKDCVGKRKPNVLLASSVFQYLEHPYEVLKSILDYEFEYFIVDRTPFIYNDHDVLTVQRVNPSIYDASYPCWFLGYTKFIQLVREKYDLLDEFDSLGKPVFLQHGRIGEWKGFFAKRRVC